MKNQIAPSSKYYYY